MARYRTAAYSRYTIFYHMVFLPRFRQKVLTNLEIDKELKAIINQMAPFHDWVIKEMETDKDHIHILLSAPPRYSPSSIVKLIKIWTQKKLFEKYPKKVKQISLGRKILGSRILCQHCFRPHNIWRDQKIHPEPKKRTKTTKTFPQLRGSEYLRIPKPPRSG